MIRIILGILVVVSALQADKVIVKTLACPSVMTLSKAPTDVDYLNLNMYAIANNCVVLSRGSKIQALGYDPRNKQEIYQKIIYKRTGATLFVFKSKIQVEQGGKKATYRF